MNAWGSYAPNPHEGGRSEYYALLAFSSLGTSVPVPRQEDSGLDLYCTLTEGDSKRAWPHAYFVVQVKSDQQPWDLNHERSVKALVEVPLPLFLCVVKKNEQRLRVYQTSPRFHVWTYPPYPPRVMFVPGEPGQGECSQWVDGERFDLSAPILEFGVDEIEKEQFRERAAEILKYWIDVDQENLQLVRHGLRAFIMPDRYVTDELPSASRVIQSLRTVSREDLGRAVSFLRAPLDGVSQQLFHHDLLSAVRGMLLLRQLYWDDDHAPQALSLLSNTLNELLDRTQTSYQYEAIDYLGGMLDLTILRSLGDRTGENLCDLQRLYLTGKHVIDSDLALLKYARDLRRLDLINTGVTDAGLKQLEGFTELRHLSLAGSDITDDGLSSLSRLAELRMLLLHETKVSSAGMIHLAGLTRLENLFLTDTQVGDDGLQPLGTLPALQELYLNGTLVTDRGLEHLRSSPNLRKVDHRRTQITESARDALLKKLPGWIEYMRETEELKKARSQGMGGQDRAGSELRKGTSSQGEPKANPQRRMETNRADKEGNPWYWWGATLLGAILAVGCVIASDLLSESKKRGILVFWLVGPPIWFHLEWQVLFRTGDGKDAEWFERFKFSQRLAARVWLAVATGIAVLYFSDKIPEWVKLAMHVPG
jgi:hypothetical protein